MDEATEWPDPEPVDEMSLLPPTAEAMTAQQALDDATGGRRCVRR